MSMRVLQELVEYYQYHSLKESFKQLDTTLKYPYKSRERAAARTSSRSPGNAHAQLARQCAPGGVHAVPVPTAQAPLPTCPQGRLSVGHTDLGREPLPASHPREW